MFWFITMLKRLLCFVAMFVVNSVKAETAPIDTHLLLELEAAHVSVEAADSETTVSLATMELGLSSRPHTQVEWRVQFLYEENDTPLEVDVASIAIQLTESLSVDVGRMYLPFGAYDTWQISDPLTLELGETRENGAVLAYSAGDLSANIYTYTRSERDLPDDTPDYGVDVGYHVGGFSAGVGVQSGMCFAGFTAPECDLDGLAMVAGYHQGAYRVYVEYVGAINGVAVMGAERSPATSVVEVGYQFADNATIALGYQCSEDLLEMPETRWLTTYAFAPIHEVLSLRLQYAYDMLATEVSTHSFVVQLAMTL